MISCTEFIPLYSEFFKFLEKRGGYDEVLRYYVRGDKDAWLAENTAENWGEAAITVPVKVSEMHAWLQSHPGTFIAAL